MKHIWFVIPVALVLIGTDVQDGASKKELKKFDGIWVMVAAENAGVKVSDDKVKKSKITWTGANAVVETPHQSKEPIKAVVVRIDGTKKPGEMDWVRDNGPDAGKKMLAIFEFIDNDNYRVCFAPAGKDRPKEFHTKVGSGHIMNMWKRTK